MLKDVEAMIGRGRVGGAAGTEPGIQSFEESRFGGFEGCPGYGGRANNLDPDSGAKWSRG